MTNKPDGSDFTHLVWEDNLDGSTLDYTKWKYEMNAFEGGNDELQLYTDYSKNVRVEYGCLVLEAHREIAAISSKVQEISSGRVGSKHLEDWKYGRLALSGQSQFV